MENRVFALIYNARTASPHQIGEFDESFQFQLFTTQEKAQEQLKKRYEEAVVQIDEPGKEDGYLDDEDMGLESLDLQETTAAIKFTNGGWQKWSIGECPIY